MTAAASASADFAFASYSALSASASLRSASASASWLRISAIFESSALPIAAGTFFHARIANTTSIARPMNIGAVSPNAVGSAWGAAGPCSTLATGCASDMELGLHRCGRLRPLDLRAGQPGDQVLSRFNRRLLDLGPRRFGRRADLRLGRRDLLGDLFGRGANLGFGLQGACLPSLASQLGRFGPALIHPSAIFGFGFLGRGPR